MPTHLKSLPSVASPVSDAGFLEACETAERLSRKELISMAIARGGRHYAPLWPGVEAVDRGSFPHEVLGCALLRGPQDVETFLAIRCGAMIVSDLKNSPQLIASAADRLGVVGRVAHIARLGLAADEHAEFWERVRAALPESLSDEQDFLPGVSRLVTETRWSGPGRGPVRVWLRTSYRR